MVCCAVIIATPGRRAVTKPFSTFAILGASLVHITGAEGSDTKASNINVPDVNKLASVALNAIPSITVTYIYLSST